MKIKERIYKTIETKGIINAYFQKKTNALYRKERLKQQKTKIPGNLHCLSPFPVDAWD